MGPHLHFYKFLNSSFCSRKPHLQCLLRCRLQSLSSSQLSSRLLKQLDSMSADLLCWIHQFHSNTEGKQHWAWIILGWETLQGISGSAGTYLPPPPLQIEYSLFRLSLSQSSD